MKEVVRWVICAILGAGMSLTLASTAQSIDESVTSIATELSTQIEKRGASKIALYGFSELNGYESALGDYLTEEMITALFISGDFDIVARRELDQVMAEHQQYGTGVFDADTIAQFGQLLGVDALITGTITRLGEQVRLNARVIDIETGRIVGAAGVTIDTDPMVESLLAQSSARSAPAAIPGMVVQPSDAVFQSRGVRVNVIGVRPDKQSNGILVSAEVTNTTSKVIWIAYAYYREEAASTKAGEILLLQAPSGLPRVTAAHQFNEDAMIRVEPNQSIPVIWRVLPTSGGNAIQGSNLYMRDTLVVHQNGGNKKIQVSLSNLNLK